MNAPALLQASQVVSSSGVSAVVDASEYAALAVMANVSALVGTAAALVFSKEGLGPDGVWYTLWSSATLRGASQVVECFGAGMREALWVFRWVRVRWQLAGSGTQATFSLCVVGR